MRHQRQFQPQRIPVGNSRERQRKKDADIIGGGFGAGPGSGMMPPSPEQKHPEEVPHKMSNVEMDQHYFDDQIFSDIGGSLKNADPISMPKPMKKAPAAPATKPQTVVANKKAHASLIAPSPAITISPAKPTITKEKVGQGVYALHFAIFYETIVGESIAVVGNLEELGLWIEYKCHLEWTEGHVWKSVEPILARESYFEYKYVLLENEKVVAWEEGVNRIADLDALPEVNDKLALKSMGDLIPDMYANKKIRHCQFNDRWEQYRVRFTVHDPLYQPGDEMTMKPSPLSGMEAVKMERLTAPNQWLSAKYGGPVPLWECHITLKNANGDSDGQYLQSTAISFQYSYAKCVKGQQEVIERQPGRSIALRDPKAYQGEISNTEASATSHWKIQDDVNIINGTVEKADGTFLEGFFFHQLYEGGEFKNIVMGPYPLYEVDVDQLVQKTKVTSVLSLQTDMDLKQRGIDEVLLKQWYKKNGVRDYQRIPITDDNNSPYADQLFEVCKLLDQLIEKNRIVYVNCTAGQSRSTSLAAFYLCLYLKAKNWKNPEEVVKAVKMCHQGASPNSVAINLGLQRYKQFQLDLFERFRSTRDEDDARRKAEDEERRRLAELAREEELRLRKMKDAEMAQREAEMAAERERAKRLEEERLRKEAELEEERRRKLMIDEERNRKRRALEEQERQRLIAIGNDRETQLNGKLRALQDDELEEIKKIKQAWLLKLQKYTNYEHYVVGEVDFGGVTEREIQEQCEALFMKGPMQFVPRKGVKVDLELKRMIDEMGITIPIVWIKGTLYLVGINKIHMEMKAEDVIAQVGGGYEKFELYIKKNHKILERQLLIKMIQCKESLEWIVDAVIRGHKIPNNSAITYDSSTNYFQNKQSASSRIQIQRRPSLRVNKEGLMINSPLKSKVGLSSSPKLRMSSPLKSPSAKKSKIATNTSPRRVNTAGMASPERANQMGQQEQKQIEKIKVAYGDKKNTVMHEIQANTSQRFEHISNKDQYTEQFNKGKYAYIHKQHNQ